MWVTNEQIEQVKTIDLLTYLKQCEPDNLVKLGGGSYCTREHDSLKISNGLWHWFSRNIGGKTALDYLIQVCGMPFTDAVATLLEVPAPQEQARDGQVAPQGQAGSKALAPQGQQGAWQAEKPKKEFILPIGNGDNSRAVQYLIRRGISKELIFFCTENGLLYEDKRFHNCIFVGRDDKNVPRYCMARGTVSDFKGELAGSDKRYSFRIEPEEKTSSVHLFESAIDLLSYITLRIMNHREWRNESYLSLSGVYETKDDTPNIPIALQAFLERNPQIRNISLHLDNDEVGRKAAAQIIKSLEGKFTLTDDPPKCGKDYNDYLRIEKEKRRELSR